MGSTESGRGRHGVFEIRERQHVLGVLQQSIEFLFAGCIRLERLMVEIITDQQTQLAIARMWVR